MRLIMVDGSEDVLEPTQYSLEELQYLVGGYIERVQYNNKIYYVNEDGYLKHLQPNASVPAFVGNVVEMTKNEERILCVPEVPDED